MFPKALALPLTVACTLLCGTASAAELRCSQMRIIVPVAAGGAADISARLTAERLGPLLKQQIVVENRPGGATLIGTNAVLSAPPDGCTMLLNSASVATFSYSFTKLGFDPLTDLAAVAHVGETPTVIVVPASSPATDLKSLVELSKTKEKGLNYSTAGYGFLQHLVIEELTVRAGAKFTHVPYKGGAQAVPDLVSARVDFGSFAAGSVMNFIKDGSLRAIAVVQEKRSALLPNVRTSAEQGFGPLNASVQMLLLAPGRTPKDLVALINAEVQKMAADPAAKQRFLAASLEIEQMSPEQVAGVLRGTAQTWGPVIKRLNIRND